MSIFHALLYVCPSLAPLWLCSDSSMSWLFLDWFVPLYLLVSVLVLAGFGACLYFLEPGLQDAHKWSNKAVRHHPLVASVNCRDDDSNALIWSIRERGERRSGQWGHLVKKLCQNKRQDFMMEKDHGWRDRVPFQQLSELLYCRFFLLERSEKLIEWFFEVKPFAESVEDHKQVVNTGWVAL